MTPEQARAAVEAMGVTSERLKLSVWDGHALPLVVEAASQGRNLAEEATHYRNIVERALLSFGAVLFRGFEVPTPEAFSKVAEGLSNQVLPYVERSAPRTAVSGNVFTSTEHPPNRVIVPHSEQSYNVTFPRKLFFYSAVPAISGGETPIYDVRNVYNRIDIAIRKAFLERKFLLIRNYGHHVGLKWQTVFQTDAASEVEEYCVKNAISWEWKPNACLRTRQIREVAARHPETGVPVWFNHLSAFHPSALELIEPGLGVLMRKKFKEDELPVSTYYGDGAPIEPDIIQSIHAAYAAEEIKFLWQKGDVLVIDNMIIAHGRSPFVPPRKQLVAMSDSYSWRVLQVPAS